MVPLLHIAVLLLFFIIICSIIGLEIYSGSFHQTCIQKDVLQKYGTFAEKNQSMISKYQERPNQICSESRTRKNPDCRPKKATLDTPAVKCEMVYEGSYDYYMAQEKEWSSRSPYICDKGYECALWLQGPNFGITTFDNVIFSMMTVFQCITMEGWTDILYYADDAIGPRFNWIYFMMLVIIGSFFMLNLVLGVLSGEFAKERERVENRRNFLKIRKRQQIDRELDGYLNWIAKAEEVILAEEEEQARTGEFGLSAPGDDDFGKSKNQKFDSMYGKLRKADGKVGTVPNNSWRDFLDRKERKLRIQVRKMVKSTPFYWAVLFLVFLNTVIISSVHHGMPDYWRGFLNIAEYVFLALFSTELILKLYGLGARTYFRSSFNKFDFAVVSGSICEVIYSYFRPDVSFGISVLRALRLLRIFKITSAWSSLRHLVVSLMSSLKSIISLIFLLFLFLVVFALLGMQVFGGNFSFAEEGYEPPPSNFDNFPSAILTVFQILTGEDWNVVMYDGIRASGGANGSGIAWSLYFIFLVLFGNYTLLNVFLAIAVDNLANAQELTKAEEEEDEEKKMNVALRKANEISQVSPASCDNIVRAVQESEAVRKANSKPSKFQERTEEMRRYNYKHGGGLTADCLDDELSSRHSSQLSLNGNIKSGSLHQAAIMKRANEVGTIESSFVESRYHARARPWSVWDIFGQKKTKFTKPPGREKFFETFDFWPENVPNLPSTGAAVRC